MLEMISQPLRRFTALGLSIVGALLIHAATLLWIHHAAISFYSAHPARWENQTLPSSQEIAVKKEEIKKRNEELAALFKDITRPQSDLEVLNFEDKSLAPAQTLLNLENIASDIDLNENELITPDLQLSHTPMKQAVESDLETDYRQSNAADILFPDDKTLAQELARSTEKAYGLADVLPAESVKATIEIEAGNSEQPPQFSLFTLDNRSGLIDQGQVDSATGHAGILTLHRPENVQWQKVQQPQRLFREALIPATNADGLRGFDASSLGAMASSSDFQLKIEYAPRMGHPGYVFKLSLSPKPGTRFKRITQNIFFLVDRSHSIRFVRFELTKQAIAKVLDQLHPGDTFNILFFDKTITRFSHNNMSVNPATLAQAKHYVMKQRYGGVNATTDLYSSLGQIIPKAVADHEINTAILLSDGDTYLNKEKQRKTIARWTDHNGSRISLFSVASGAGNNAPLLDLLSIFNHGTLYYSLQDQEIEYSLSKLVQDIQHPIGKEMSTTVIGTLGNRIKIFPSRALAPNLYENIPYVVYGVIDQLADFHVFFQGKYYDKMLDIKQSVSFDKGVEGNQIELERMLALHQAYESYLRFFKEGDYAHLQQAKQLLLPYNISIAFQ